MIQKCPGKTLQMLDSLKKKKKNVVPTKLQQPPAHLFNVPFSKWYGIQLFFSLPLHSDADGSVACLPPSQSQKCIVSAVSFFLNGLFLGRKRFLVSCIRELKCVNMYLGQLQWPHLVGVYWIWNGSRHCKRVLCKSFPTIFQRNQFGHFLFCSCSSSFFFIPL